MLLPLRQIWQELPHGGLELFNTNELFLPGKPRILHEGHHVIQNFVPVPPPVWPEVIDVIPM